MGLRNSVFKEGKYMNEIHIDMFAFLDALFIFFAWYLGRNMGLKVRRVPTKAFCATYSYVACLISIFMMTAERFGDIEFIFDRFNGWDTNPAWSFFLTFFVIVGTGITVAMVCYNLLMVRTKQSNKVKERKAKRKVIRVNFGEYNQMAYGDTCTVEEMVPVLID